MAENVPLRGGRVKRLAQFDSPRSGPYSAEALRGPTMNPTRLKFIIAGAVIVAAMVLLFRTSLDQAGASYYIPVSEFVSHGPSGGNNFRVNGKVTPGSVVQPAGGTELRFTMEDSPTGGAKVGPGSLKVVYRGLVPDTFTDS